MTGFCGFRVGPADVWLARRPHVFLPCRFGLTSLRLQANFCTKKVAPGRRLTKPTPEKFLKLLDRYDDSFEDLSEALPLQPADWSATLPSVRTAAGATRLQRSDKTALAVAGSAVPTNKLRRPVGRLEARPRRLQLQVVCSSSDVQPVRAHGYAADARLGCQLVHRLQGKRSLVAKFDFSLEFFCDALEKLGCLSLRCILRVAVFSLFGWTARSAQQ